MKWQVTAEYNNFQGDMGQTEAHFTQNVTKYTVAKSMANIISQLGCDFQQGGFLYKPTSSSQ